MASFSDFFINIDDTSAYEHIIARLASDGIFTFDMPVEDARRKLQKLAREMGDIHYHPDAESDGITIIAPREDVAARPGLFGFSRNTLDLHTDGSSIADPPDQILNYCYEAAQFGGETLLVDTKKVFAALLRERPGDLHKLTRPFSIVFGTDGGRYTGAIFEERPEDRVLCRFRADGAGFSDIRIVESICILTEYFKRFCISLKLKSGQGYAVNNGRWLHGRSKFHGSRKFMRLFVRAHEGGDHFQHIRGGFDIGDHPNLTAAQIWGHNATTRTRSQNVRPEAK